MRNCEFLGICPILSRFRSEDTANLWIKMYCKGPTLDRCVRRSQRLDHVQNIPITLLPNGKTLPTLKRTPLQRPKRGELKKSTQKGKKPTIVLPT